MSLPPQQIETHPTYKTQWRVSSSQRNISNPYSLAIPPEYKRRSSNRSIRMDTLTRPAAQTTKSSDTLQVPRPPKKAVLVTQKPTHPHVDNIKSISTAFTQDHVSSQDPAPKKPKKIDDRVLALSVTLALIVLLAICIPLGIILPQKLVKPLPIKILVPSYVYPEPGAWDQLYDGIAKHPENAFTVVINPDNGPGGAAWPDQKYITAIKALSVFLNVRTIGYINTAGGTRDDATIREQIAKYAGWPKVNGKLGLQGIFFDQTPYKDEGDARVYLKNISETVRQTEGFGSSALVVHNPGRVPDEGLRASKPDVTVVFEGKYADMPGKEKLSATLSKSKGSREEFGMLVNSVPEDVGKGGLRRIVESVRRDVEWLYVTDLTEDVYAGYGSTWKEWLDVTW